MSDKQRPERRYQLTKVSAGDWLLPSNDAQTLWRLTYNGTWWSLYAFAGSADLNAFDPADVRNPALWRFECGMLHTRTQAIDKAMGYGEPEPSVAEAEVGGSQVDLLVKEGASDGGA